MQRAPAAHVSRIDCASCRGIYRQDGYLVCFLLIENRDDEKGPRQYLVWRTERWPLSVCWGYTARRCQQPQRREESLRQGPARLARRHATKRMSGWRDSALSSTRQLSATTSMQPYSRRWYMWNPAATPRPSPQRERKA